MHPETAKAIIEQIETAFEHAAQRLELNDCDGEEAEFIETLADGEAAFRQAIRSQRDYCARLERKLLAAAKHQAIIAAERDAAIARPKRTPAHERAIRRAWGERKAAQAARRDVERERARGNEAVQQAVKYRTWWESVSRDASVICAERDALAFKRRRALLKARDLQKRLSAEYKVVDHANERRQRANAKWRAAESELAKARNANAALQQRAERAETANADGLAKLDMLARRVSMAETQLARASA
jgi:hypothetical protein